MAYIAPHLAIEGSVARLSLEAPRRHNALSLDDLAAFAGHLERVRTQSGLHALVLDEAERLGTAMFASAAARQIWWHGMVRGMGEGHITHVLEVLEGWGGAQAHYPARGPAGEATR